MNRQDFERNLLRVHQIFAENEKILNNLSLGIVSYNQEREILVEFLEHLELENTSETRYAASARIGNKKFEPLDSYLEKI